MAKTYFDMGATRQQKPDFDMQLGKGFRAYEEALEVLRAMIPKPWDVLLGPLK